MAHPEQNQWGERMGATLRAVSRFSVGESIVLRSGGPFMTVTDIRYNADHLDAIWLEGPRAAEVRCGAFPVAGLRRVTWLDRLCAAFGG